MGQSLDYHAIDRRRCVWL